jgi:hypothetical protein
MMTLKSSAPREVEIEVPSVDSPNRMEIDPGDIPPSERPRNPNVDDRTKIPDNVISDDRPVSAN